MKALQIECSSYEWWGDRWDSAIPYSLDFQTLPDNHCLTNAPVTVFVLTPDALEAAQLLRLLAARLEQQPQLLQPLSEPGNPAQDAEGVPF